MLVNLPISFSVNNSSAVIIDGFLLVPIIVNNNNNRLLHCYRRCRELSVAFLGQAQHR